MATSSFDIYDWIVFVAILLIAVGIGLYHSLSGGRQKTTGEFLMGNRKMSLLPTAVSILVSFQSAILLLGAPAEVYTKGTQYYLYTFGQMIAVVLASIIYVPLFYPLKLTSMYEYLELRFNSRAAKLTGTIINIISTLIYTGIASFAPSTALQAVSGFPEWASFLLIGVVCTLYTFLGGLRAVIWVDAFQFFIMLTGILAIFIKGMLDVGGFGEVWRLNESWDRINFWNFDPDPTVRHTFWGLIIGAALNWVGTYGASQASIQRYSALRSLKEAKLAILVNCIGVFLLITGACLMGITVFAFYAKAGCDPYTNKEIKNKNQIIPYFVMDVLNFPGIPGLFIACLFSGALSSLSSNLSSLSTITWEDIVKPHYKWRSERTKTRITRLIVIVYGVLGTGVTFLVKNLKGTVLQASLSFMGAASGALNGIVILGAFFPWCNWIGAIAGSVTSYGVMLWINIAKYSVIGSPETLDFPTAKCSPFAHNTSFSTSSPQFSSLYINTSYEYSVFTNMPITTMNSTSIPEVTTVSADILESIGGLNKLYSLSYLWYSTFGTLVCVIIGLITSLITGPTKKHEVSPKYLIPIFDRLCCCLPRNVRHFLQCDIDHSRVHEHEVVEELRSTDSKVIDGSTHDKDNGILSEQNYVENHLQNGTGTYKRYGVDEEDGNTALR